MRYFEKLFHTVILSMFIGLMSSFAFAADPVKVGFVYVGPIGDHGWTYRHDIGRQQVEEAYGDKVETTFVESVPEGPDAERVMRQMAKGGADIIFATSFGYMQSMAKVAKEFPNVKFEHATGYKQSENMATYGLASISSKTCAGYYCRHDDKDKQDLLCCCFPDPRSYS
jgi:basic membrane protein A